MPRATAEEPPPPPDFARIVIVEDAEATRAFRPDRQRVRRMLERGLTNLTALTEIRSAWLSLVSTQDVIGIKVHVAPGAAVGTRPEVAEAVVLGLLQAGIPTNHIVIWDRHAGDLEKAGFGDVARRCGVRLAGAVESGWDASVYYDFPFPGHLLYGDRDFRPGGENVGRKSYVSKLVSTELNRIINVSPLLNHNAAGVSGNLYSLVMGSVDNWQRFERDTQRCAQAIPEIYALPALGDKVALHIVDALVAQYEGEHLSRLHASTVLNQLRLSHDPVALDVLSIQELEWQRTLRGAWTSFSTNALEIYRNAALLEIGVDQPKRMIVETLRESAP